MELSTYLGLVGINPANLDDATQRALNQWLATVARAGLDTAVAILKAKAAGKGIKTDGTATADEQKALAQAAADEAKRQQQAEAAAQAKARQQRTVRIVLGVVGGVALIGVGLVVYFTHKRG